MGPLAKDIRSSELIMSYNCRICGDKFQNPKVLPQCGHSFCRECIYLKRRKNGKFTCPDCCVERDIPGDGLVTNIRLKNLANAVTTQIPEIQDIRSYLVWKDQCPHYPMLDTASVCQHCSLKFCDICLVRHLESLRLETLCIGQGIDVRMEKAVGWLKGNFEDLTKSIDEQAETIEWEIATVCSGLEEAIKTAINERKGQLISKTREIASQKREEVKAKLDTATENLARSLEPELRELNASSVLQWLPNDIEKLYQSTLKREQEVSALEESHNFAESGKLCFQSNLANDEKLKELIRSISEIGSVEWQAKEDKKGKQKEEPTTMTRLMSAVNSGDLAQLKSLLEALPTSCIRHAIEHHYAEGSTLLIKAIELGHLDIVRYLVLEQKANLDDYRWDLYLSPPLHIAATFGHVEIVKFLVEHRPSLLKKRDCDKYTVLMRAAIAGQLEVVKYLVGEKHCNLETLDACGRNVLQNAARDGTVEVVKYLVESGADIFKKEEIDDGYAAIHLAAMWDNADIVEYLAKVEPKLMSIFDNYGYTPVHVAAENLRVNTLELLLKLSPENLERKTKKGQTPLVTAIFSDDGGKLATVNFLLERGADPSVRFRCSWYDMGENNEETPIHVAAVHGKVQIMVALLAKRPDLIHLKNSRGQTALDLAKDHQCKESIRFLEKKLAGK